MTTDRRSFMQQLAMGGLGAAAVPGLAGAGALPATAPTAEAATASTAAAEWRAQAQQGAAAVDFDTAWPARLTGKHRAVFDVPEIEGGSGVWRAGLWSTHYADVLKAPAAEIQPVIVIRHSAIPLLMSQEFWATYRVGKETKVTHPMTEKRTQRNPVMMTEKDDGLPPFLAKLALDQQAARGAIVLGCNMAFGRMVGMVMAQDKLDAKAAREKALGFLLPGAILQPNGIFGLILAQQHGCAFVNAV